MSYIRIVQSSSHVTILRLTSCSNRARDADRSVFREGLQADWDNRQSSPATSDQHPKIQLCVLYYWREEACTRSTLCTERWSTRHDTLCPLRPSCTSNAKHPQLSQAERMVFVQCLGLTHSDFRLYGLQLPKQANVQCPSQLFQSRQRNLPFNFSWGLLSE